MKYEMKSRVVSPAGSVFRQPVCPPFIRIESRASIEDALHSIRRVRAVIIPVQSNEPDDLDE